MIKKITILSVIAIFIASIVYVNNFAFSYSNGGQGAGYSTSPGDGSKGCNNCHGSTPTSKTWLTSNVPTAGYTGGTIYTLTFAPTSACGFDITSEKTGSTKVGTFASGTGYTRYNTNRSIVSTTNTSSKTFSWTAPAAGTGAVTFYGCFAPNSNTNYKSSLIINEACTAPTLSVSPTSPTVCSGSSTTLTASGTSTSYSWSSGATTAAITVAPTSNITYTVTGTLSGCTSTSSVSVSVNALPTVNVAASSSTICSGSSVTLTASGTATSYSWSSGSTVNPITVSPTSNTTYTVTGTLSSCTSTKNTSITVNATPATPVITQTVGFTLSSSASTGNQWYEQTTGLISGATNQTYTPTVNGIYYSIVTVNGCPSAQSNKITIITIDIPEVAGEGGINYYPNPANDQLNIVIPEATDAKLLIYNIQGQLLIGPISATQKITSINVAILEKGIYILKAESTKGTIIRRFIKE
jgi:hypothetical protein